MTKGKVPANNNFYDRYFFDKDPHRTLVDQVDAGKYIVGRARADAIETDFLWQIWTVEYIGTEQQITYASDGEPRFRWIDRLLVTDPSLPDDGSPGGIYIADPKVDAGSPAGTLVGFLFPMAKDVGTLSYAFEIISDPSDKFVLDPNENNKLLLSDTAFGIDNEYMLEVRVVDSLNRFYQQWITVDVVNIKLTNDEVSENALLGTKVADIIAVNDDPPTSFTLLSDPDGKFTISGSDLLTNDAFDFSTKEEHEITIQYTDSTSKQRQETFIIKVDPDNQSLLSAVTEEDRYGNQGIRVIEGDRKIFPLYNEVTHTGIGDITVLSLTVPLGKGLLLYNMQGSGDNKALYRVEVNGSVVCKVRTYYTNYNTPLVDLGELPLVEGDLVEIIAESKTNEPAGFNATLKYKERDL